MDIISELILQHGRFSPYKGKIKDPTKSLRLNNPVCGDEIKIEIKIKKETISEIVFSGEGCLISQAAASLIVEEAKRVKLVAKIKQFNEQKVFKLLGTKPTLSRQKCALLGLEVLKKIVN